MQLAFATRRLRDLCEDEEAARRVYPAPVVEALEARLADLRAADSIFDLPVGDPVADGSSSIVITVDLCDGYELVFVSNHATPPRTPSRDIDIARVRRLKLIEIRGGGS